MSGTIALMGGGAFTANDELDSQLLAAAGAQRVVVLPNSRCEALVNHTRLRSGVELSLPLDPACPQLLRTLPVLREECDAFAADPAWADQLLGPPIVRGVKRVTPLMVELSILVLTRAGQQWAVERELLGRLVSRMEREGLRLAAVRQVPELG